MRSPRSVPWRLARLSPLSGPPSARSPQRRRPSPVALLVFVLAFGATTSCLAESPSPGRAHEETRVRATGRATVVAEPDRVVVELAVATTAEQADAAAGENAKRARAVLDALREALGAEAGIESSGYTLSPAYRFQKGGGRVLEGFTARSRLRVTHSDVRAAGRIIDVAVAAGADEVDAVRFTLEDDDAQRDRALELATRAARRRAEVMAAAVDLRVLRVVTIEEGVRTVIPVERRAFAAVAAAESTPVEPGAVEIHAEVVIEVEVGR